MVSFEQDPLPIELEAHDFTGGLIFVGRCTVCGKRLNEHEPKKDKRWPPSNLETKEEGIDEAFVRDRAAFYGVSEESMRKFLTGEDYGN